MSITEIKDQLAATKQKLTKLEQQLEDACKPVRGSIWKSSYSESHFILVKTGSGTYVAAGLTTGNTWSGICETCEEAVGGLVFVASSFNEAFTRIL